MYFLGQGSPYFGSSGVRIRSPDSISIPDSPWRIRSLSALVSDYDFIYSKRSDLCRWTSLWFRTAIEFRCIFFSCKFADTLLNVFIAIAVDNLAQAQAMTAAELAAAEQLITPGQRSVIISSATGTCNRKTNIIDMYLYSKEVVISWKWCSVEAGLLWKEILLQDLKHMQL